ncbi:MAG: tRNA lysidine(34) synthetase TilS [Planctomycetota bacterium]
MHQLEQQFSERQGDPFRQHLTTVVAVSGGSDSVALLRLTHAATALAASGCELVVAHVNHRWRDDALHVAAFVSQLAHSLGLACDVEEVQTQGITSEETARDQRYERLIQMAHRRGARYLITGHTADDQAETVLFHILRGTGLRGLAGIPAVRRLDESLTLKRPLLEWRRAQLRAYLTDIEQDFVDDESNRDLQFTRNRIRHELLPQLTQMFPSDPRDALRRLSGVAREAIDELQPTIEACLDAALQPGSTQDLNRVVLHCPTLMRHSALVVREALARLWQRQRWPLGEMTYNRWVELASLALSAQEATTTFPGGVRATRAGDTLQLARLPRDASTP